MKAITPDSYLVRPFVTHKTQNYTYTFLSGSNPEQISIDVASVPPALLSGIPSGGTGPINPSGIYAYELYHSVLHLFYSSASVWNGVNKNFLPTGSSFYVISFAQPSYGEGIFSGSLTISSPSSTGSLVDYNGWITTAGNTSSVVGNIFYTLGIAVIQKDTSAFSSSIVSQNGIYLTTGSQVFIEFDATKTIYEHQVICTIEPSEFNYSSNPSLVLFPSSSVTGSIKILDQFASGTLTPYMTTVGLYNDAKELLAIAKFPRAIKRSTLTQQSIIVRLDM